MSKLNYTLKGTARHLLDVLTGAFPIFQYFYTDNTISELYFTDDGLTEALVSEDF